MSYWLGSTCPSLVTTPLVPTDPKDLYQGVWSEICFYSIPLDCYICDAYAAMYSGDHSLSLLHACTGPMMVNCGLMYWTPCWTLAATQPHFPSLTPLQEWWRPNSSLSKTLCSAASSRGLTPYSTVSIRRNRAQMWTHMFNHFRLIAMSNNVLF